MAAGSSDWPGDSSSGTNVLTNPAISPCSPGRRNKDEFQRHWQCLLNLLRPQDRLQMAVRLESCHPGRTRYLVVISTGPSTCTTTDSSSSCTNRLEFKRNSANISSVESCLLGVDLSVDLETDEEDVDCQVSHTQPSKSSSVSNQEHLHIGLVFPVWADTSINLDGDGGFSVSSGTRQHIFKPISVQAMWSSLQMIHEASSQARSSNSHQGSQSHKWTAHYTNQIDSDRSRLNEWNAMDGLTSKRPLSPDATDEPAHQKATKVLIRSKLKEIMTSVDLDEVTSKFIRTRLEQELDMDLIAYKSYIDEEMLKILGQMDTATQMFDYLFLGSEWNASNLEELKSKGSVSIPIVSRLFNCLLYLIVS